MHDAMQPDRWFIEYGLCIEKLCIEQYALNEPSPPQCNASSAGPV
jgi:hypothetical protein